MEFKILGPLEAWHDGKELPLGSGRQRALLALLLIHPNVVLSTDRIVDELWGGRPPDTAVKVLQGYVSQLRKTLSVDGVDGSAVLATRPPGYVLQLPADALDARRFESLTERARAVRADNPKEAAALLRSALELWRGEPLADVAYDAFAQAEIGRLVELRLAALEDRIDSDLALGRHAALVPELEAHVAAHPLRERARAQLMLALYRSGRQADALEVYRETRRTLVDDLGVEPGPELQGLEQAILAQDPSLTSPPAPFPSAPRRLHRRLLLLLALVAALVAAATAVFWLTRDNTPTVVPNSVVEIDPDSNDIRDVVPVGDAPGAIATSGRQLWVANRGDDTLTHIDTSTDERRTLGGFPFPTSLAADGIRIWVGNNESGVIVAIDSETGREVERISIPGHGASYLALGDSSIWVSEEELAIMRVAQATGRVTDRWLDSAHDVAYGYGAAWFVRAGPGELLRVDARDETRHVIRVGSLPEGIAVGLGAVWVASSRDGVVRRVNPTTGNVESIIPVGEGPLGAAAGGGAVWVANGGDGTVSRIDPGRNRVVETVRVGYVPTAVHVGAGGVWVAVQAQQ